MSDERDETRRFSPSDDTTPSGASQSGTSQSGTSQSGASQSGASQSGASQSGASPEGDATQISPRPEATSVLQPVTQDWEPNRAEPVWSGRAEVRAPQPSRTAFDTDWPAGPVAQPRDRWWMPIVVGTIVLVMLAVLGWAIYLIMRSVGRDDSPAPASTSADATTTTTTTTATTTPTTEPTTPSATPPTTEPTMTEVTVPALRGLTLTEAKAALDRTGLSIRVIYRDSDAPARTVIDSDPAEGQEVPPDTRVTLVIAARSAATTPTGTTTTRTEPAEGSGVSGN